MSLMARKRASLVRGMTMAEHLVYYRLCAYHNFKNPNPFPKHATLCFQFECSRIYLRQILQSIAKMRFIKRKKRLVGFDEDGPQDANAYEIDFTRWFPYKDEKAEKENTEMLGFFRRAIKDPYLSQGFLAAWIEPRRTRSKRKLQTLWIALESGSVHKFLREHFEEIMDKIRSETGRDFNVRPLPTYDSDE